MGSNRFSFGRGGGRQLPTPPNGGGSGRGPSGGVGGANRGAYGAGGANGGRGGVNGDGVGVPPGGGAPVPPMPSAPPTYDDEPGHTRAFTVGDAPDGPVGGPVGGPAPAYGAAYEPGPVPGFGPPPQSDGAAQGDGGDHGGPGHGDDGTRVTTYRAGQRHPEVGGARLAWRPLLAGIYRQPERTFAQMRWHQVWGPALVVSAVYGALAVFGFDDTRGEVVDAAFSVALTIVLTSAVGIIVAGLMFGGVTHVLARRLGGDGAWAPTIGLAMIISWTTDAPRLLFSFFLPSGNAFVQLLGWATWLLCAGLLTSMVRQLHDLPWAKALGAASLQLIALLILIKLPILG